MHLSSETLAIQEVNFLELRAHHDTHQTLSGRCHPDLLEVGQTRQKWIVKAREDVVVGMEQLCHSRSSYLVALFVSGWRLREASMTYVEFEVFDAGGQARMLENCKE